MTLLGFGFCLSIVFTLFIWYKINFLIAGIFFCISLALFRVFGRMLPREEMDAEVNVKIKEYDSDTLEEFINNPKFHRKDSKTKDKDRAKEYANDLELEYDEIISNMDEEIGMSRFVRPGSKTFMEKFMDKNDFFNRKGKRKFNLSQELRDSDVRHMEDADDYYESFMR